VFMDGREGGEGLARAVPRLRERLSHTTRSWKATRHVVLRRPRRTPRTIHFPLFAVRGSGREPRDEDVSGSVGGQRGLLGFPGEEGGFG